MFYGQSLIPRQSCYILIKSKKMNPLYTQTIAYISEETNLLMF
jgi:hypothetical protein